MNNLKYKGYIRKCGRWLFVKVLGLGKTLINYEESTLQELKVGV